MSKFLLWAGAIVAGFVVVHDVSSYLRSQFCELPAYSVSISMEPETLGKIAEAIPLGDCPTVIATQREQRKSKVPGLEFFVVSPRDELFTEAQRFVYKR